jgi:hypothetical protein
MATYHVGTAVITVTIMFITNGRVITFSAIAAMANTMYN